MALKAVLTTAEFTALPEPLREHYAAADHETYVLDADIDSHPRVGGLKSALKKERESTKAASDEARRLKESIGDLDPDKAREAMARVQELHDKKLIDENQVLDIVKARTEAKDKAYAAELKARDAKLEETAKAYQALEGKYTTRVLNGTIQDDALRVGGRKEYLPDIIYRLTTYGVDGVTWRLDGDEVVAMRGEEIVYGKDGVQPMPIGEGLESLRKSNPLYFEDSRGGGAQNHARSDGNRFVISETDAGDIGKWRAAKAAADKAGQELRIQPAS